MWGGWQALISAPAASIWASPGGVPWQGGAHGREGPGSRRSPALSCFTHPLLHRPASTMGTGGPGTGCGKGEERGWRGRQGDSGKIPGGPLQPRPHHRSARDSAHALCRPFSAPDQGRAKKTGIWSPRELAGVTKPRPGAHDTRTGNGGQQKTFTGAFQNFFKKISTSIYKPGDWKQDSDFPRS